MDGVGGRIVECEAYERDDPASHAFPGPDARATRACSGPRAALYVYRSYGIHWLLNIVCGAREGAGEAVLVRALEPTTGIESMRARRGREALRRALPRPRPPRPGARRSGPTWTASRSAPAASSCAWARRPAASSQSPRIGISRARELPWRFALDGLALRQLDPSLTISVISAPFAARISGIGYCE